MAELKTSATKFDVVNTPVGHVNNMDDTPLTFNFRPDLFYAKLDDGSRIAEEATSNNNPIEINLREFEW